MKVVYNVTPDKNPEIKSLITPLIDLLVKENEYWYSRTYGKTARNISRYLARFGVCRAFVHEDNWQGVFVTIIKLSVEEYMSCFRGRDEEIKQRAKILYKKAMLAMIKGVQDSGVLDG